MKLFKFKNEDEMIEEQLEKFDVVDDSNQETQAEIEHTMTFTLDNDENVDDGTKVFDKEEFTDQMTEEEIASNQETAEPEQSTEEDDDDEYEYVIPHYGRNAFLLAVCCIIVGMVATFFVMKQSMTEKITADYISQGYAITATANATSEDIREGKTAYVRGQLVTGTYIDIDTTQATATAEDILAGYTAYANGQKVVGSIQTYTGKTLITPSTSDYIIYKGVYLPDDIIIPGDTNLTSGNIKKGVKIFNITGSYTGE